MTSYHGGKQKIGKTLAEVIYDISTEVEEDEDFEIKGYCEPFCGMLGVYQHIPELFAEHRPKLKYKAGDANESVIKMWKAAQKGWKPPKTCEEAQYELLKRGPPSALQAFVGHQCSFGGQYFKGFIGKYGRSTSSASAATRVEKIGKRLKNVTFKYGSYGQFSNLKGFIIYCDPPYFSTHTRYQGSFDADSFTDWCEKMSEHNLVFVSEYSRPQGSNVSEVYKSTLKTPSVRGSKVRGTEKLYFYE